MIFFERGKLTEIGAEIVLHLTNNQLNYSGGVIIQKNMDEAENNWLLKTHLFLFEGGSGFGFSIFSGG